MQPISLPATPQKRQKNTCIKLTNKPYAAT